MKDQTRTVAAVIVLAVLAGAFFLVGLKPKREEAASLQAEVTQLQADAAVQQQALAEAQSAKAEFGGDYQQLVLLGKAVPDGDDTASLLVELNRVAERAGVDFRSIELQGSTDTASAAAAPVPAPVAPAPADASAGTPVAAPVATEASAAVLPIGASIGTAGLGVMPYKLTFKGGFFGVADFIKGLDRLVQTKSRNIAVDGRLVTIDGFSLSPDPTSGLPDLQATFSVTTYLVPPTQGATAGATAATPAPTAVPTSTATTP